MEAKLIESVRCFPCLWQVSDPSYKDVTARQNAWKDVASQVENNSNSTYYNTPELVIHPIYAYLYMHAVHGVIF